MKLKQIFVSSYHELKNIRSLTTMGMLLAIRIILSIFVTLPINDSLKIGMSFVATAILGMLYGPVSAGIVSGIADILQAFIKPTGPFFPGWTISAALGGMIYGVLLYKNDFKKPINYIPKIIFAKSLINIFVNAFLGTFWLKVSLGKAMNALFIPRLIKNISLLPFEALILCVLLPVIYSILKRSKLINSFEV